MQVLLREEDLLVSGDYGLGGMMSAGGALKRASDLDAGLGLQERSLHMDSQLNSEAEQR